MSDRSADRVAWVIGGGIAIALLLTSQLAPVLLLVDDAFYVFKIARNSTAGSSFTFDGIHQTDGFHPLWMLGVGALARVALGSIDHLARMVLVLQTALVLFGARRLLATFGATARGRTGALLLFGTFYFTKIFINGLEAALEFFFMAWSFEAFALAARRGVRATFLASCLASLTVLARLSAIAFALPLVAIHLIHARDARRARGIAATLGFLVPLTIYLGLHARTAGHLLPVNAAIKGTIIHDATLGERLVPWIAMVSLVFAAILFLWRAYANDSEKRLALVPLALYAIAECTGDCLVRANPIPDIWYLVPYATIALLVVAEMADRLHTRSISFAVLTTLYAALLIVTWCLRLRPISYAPYLAARRTGEWLAANTPVDSIVAGWDCGIAGAYSERRFINLDGLVNSWRYKDEYLDRGRVRAYLDDENVAFVAQPIPLAQIEGNAPLFKSHVDLSDWHVIHADCYTFESILSAKREAFAHVVLARDASTPRLRDYRGRESAICSGTDHDRFGN